MTSLEKTHEALLQSVVLSLSKDAYARRPNLETCFDKLSTSAMDCRKIQTRTHP